MHVITRVNATLNFITQSKLAAKLTANKLFLNKEVKYGITIILFVNTSTLILFVNVPTIRNICHVDNNRGNGAHKPKASTNNYYLYTWVTGEFLV